MVVAEALSVETPVLLTNKVNLWREVIDSNCGLLLKNDQHGIDTLIEKWTRNEHAKMHSNAGLCFRSKLHIQKAAKEYLQGARTGYPLNEDNNFTRSLFSSSSVTGRCYW